MLLVFSIGQSFSFASSCSNFSQDSKLKQIKVKRTSERKCRGLPAIRINDRNRCIATSTVKEFDRWTTRVIHRISNCQRINTQWDRRQCNQISWWVKCKINKLCWTMRLRSCRHSIKNVYKTFCNTAWEVISSWKISVSFQNWITSNVIGASLFFSLIPKKEKTVTRKYLQEHIAWKRERK